jgi:predicted permease
MTFAAKLRSWLRAMRNRSRMEREMDHELRFHIESYVDDLVKQGVPREEAMRRARIEFGGLEMHKEECRASLGLRIWDELFSDLRYALRMMKQSPGFTLVAVLSLALGIGANTAIFTVAKAVLLKTMAVPHPERLRLLTYAAPRDFDISGWGSWYTNAAGIEVGTPFPYAVVREMQRHQEVLEDLVAFKDLRQLTANAGAEAEAVNGELVSGNFYAGLGARMIAGRAIGPADDTESAPAVAVISDAYWARRFGRSADVLGKTIRVNRVPVTVIGVNAPEFHGAQANSTPELFLPFSLQPEVIPDRKGSLLNQNQFWWVVMLGREKPGVTDEATQAALNASFRNALRPLYPGTPDKALPRIVLETGNRGLDKVKGEFSKPIYVLMGAAGLVLLIACANLANLLLARASVRQREMSVRVAMGAGRFRVMRQVLTESMLLASFGGIAGLALGVSGRNFIPDLFEASWRTSSMRGEFDWMVFAYALGITVATGLLFGAAPAWRSTKADLNAGLKETGRMTVGSSTALLGKSLVAFQVALSVLLLAGAGLFLRTLMNLKSTTLGFNPERILLFQLDPPRSRYQGKQRVAFFQEIEEKLAGLPGVQGATLSENPLVADSASNGCYHPTDRAAPRPGHEDLAYANPVGSHFFETLQMPILYGRGFTDRDSQTAPKVAVINQRLARQFFPNGSALGKTIGAGCAGRGGAESPVIYEVVGVSADAKYARLRQDAPPTIFFPYRQSDDVDWMTFEIKTAASTASVAAEVREAVRSVDKDLPLLEVRLQTEQIEANVSQERVFATLTGGFGVLALMLAGIGIYGIMAYTVSRRTNEIGIRMALGAQARGVLAMVLKETSVLALIGVAAGIGAALGVTRLVASMLYDVKPDDPLTFVGAAGLLVIIALAAALTPARRAAGVDPMQALRHE